MVSNIFVNLPVRDLKKTNEFFSKLGFNFNPQFSDDNATCMVLSDTIYVMLLVEKFFQTFTNKPVGDARKDTSAILAVSLDSRQAVDDMLEKAVAAGATDMNKTQDHGWMYSRALYDLDGHMWEFMYADMSQLPADVHQ